MNRFLLTILFAFIFLFGIAQKLPPRPSPPRLVNDFTNTLSPDQVETLERKLVAYDDSTSNQIAIVIVATTDDYAPVDYATKLGREWGIGNKKTNNGVLLLVAKDDHQIFIAPGYGLEGAIPDIIANSIAVNEIKPNFKANDFYRGLDLGTSAIMKAAAGEYKAPVGYNKKGKSGGGSGSFVFIIIVVIIILILSRGGGGGGMVSRRGYGNFVTGAILGNILGGGRGGGSGGGFGGFGGGGDSGGGFGGFGGGSFGGGGSGSSW